MRDIVRYMSWSIFFKEYFTPLLAASFGFVALKHFNFFWKLLFTQVLIYIIAIKIVYYITPGIQTTNNHWFYNSYVIFEIALLCFSPYFYFRNLFSRSWLFIFFVFYLIAYFIQINREGFNTFANFAFATAGLILTVIYGSIVYIEFRKANDWVKSPEIWASAGLLIFFACNVPYFSLFNYLNKNHLSESRFLFNFITDVLANIRYLFLAIAFWLLRRNSFQSKTLYS